MLNVIKEKIKQRTTGEDDGNEERGPEGLSASVVCAQGGADSVGLEGGKGLARFTC